MVFFGRHWLVAITNAAVTALLGLGLVKIASTGRALRLSPLNSLRLRRFVLLCALYKGALFLMLGISFSHSRPFPVFWGIQIPNPRELLCLVPASSTSIWHPTSASKWVSILLVGAASVFLMWRGFQLIKSLHALNALLRFEESARDERVDAIFQRAATALDLSPSSNLPAVILADVPYPTPMLVGLRHPYLLLSPRLARVLTEQELEMAFRHELAHFRHHDQWWRWLFVWLEDVGRLNLLSGRLGGLALDAEEELCDRVAVHSPQEALILASAIQKSLKFYQNQLPVSAPNPVAAPEQDMVSKMGNISQEENPFGLSVPTNELPSSEAVSVPKAAANESADFRFAAMPVTGRSKGSRPKSPDGQTPLPLPSRVLPALLGRHTRKWSRTATLNSRLRALLSLAHDTASRGQQASHENATPLKEEPSNKGVQPKLKRFVVQAGRFIFQSCARVVLAVLLLIIIYIRFYIAFVFQDHH